MPAWVPPEEPKTSFQLQVEMVLANVGNLLVEKNRKYGDAALRPLRVFSRQNSIEQIKVRIDDKLSRLLSQQPDEDEDVELDLLGYLVLLQIARANVKKKWDETKCSYGSKEVENL